jgi:hydroxypyruvate reductase
VTVLALGKAALGMAAAAEAALGERLVAGLAVSSVPGGRLRRIRAMAAGHPTPDARGLRAARAVEALLARLSPEDVLLVLLSGGASALLPAPVAGVSLKDKATLAASLMRAGATIHELNAVRKHLSRLKGGGLVRAARGARVVTLVLSDVVGNDLSTIASGPTVPDPTTYAEALSVLRKRGVLRAAPSSVRSHLRAGAAGRLAETPKPGDPVFRRTRTILIGSNVLSVRAAVRQARRLGFRTRVLTTTLEGEAREVGPALVAALRQKASRSPGWARVCRLASGETTVTVRGPGRGGRNQELVVACARPLARLGRAAVVASLASDGVDGHSAAAGGIVDDESLLRAHELGLAPPEAFLTQSDSESFLAPLGDLIVTGPTGTNVLDLVALLS